MSFATSINAVSFRPSTTVSVRRSQPRTGRTHLSVHAVTNWLLEPKANESKRGQKLDLTEAVADKGTAVVKSGGGGDFELKGLEAEGLNLEFRSEGERKTADSPADLFLKDTGSKVDIFLDGEKLEKNKEYKLSIGQTLKFGEDAVFQVLRDARAHA